MCLFPVCTEGAATRHCRYSHTPDGQGELTAHLSSAGSREHCGDLFAVGSSGCVLPIHHPLLLPRGCRTSLQVSHQRGDPWSLALLEALSPTQTQGVCWWSLFPEPWLHPTGAMETKIPVRAMKRVFGVIKLLWVSCAPCPKEIAISSGTNTDVTAKTER